MKNKILANVVQQVHWDPEWYFTEEDTTVQFAYNTRELLNAMESGKLKQFFLDGKTDALIDYLNSHSEDLEKVKKLITENRLVLGPFHSQLDCFISSGEGIIRNLNMGIELANNLGGSSMLAWLPDSFGHTQDFPKIFAGFGIKDFIFRRGMGDEHNLPLDFYWESNDSSKVLCNVLQSGYGFATPAFVSGKLTDKTATNYQGKDLNKEFLTLARESTVDSEFLLPIGFDLNPAIENFDELLQKYSSESEQFNFEETTFANYMYKIRNSGTELKTYQGEFMNAQYHRMHRSLFSARADIKTIQDKVERILTYEVQPLMSMADKLGIKYDKGLLDRAWDLLIRSQTHSSATNTDKTNELIKTRSARAYNIAESCKVFLMRKIAVTIPRTTEDFPLVIFNTLAYKRDITTILTVYTKSQNFRLTFENKDIPYTIIEEERRFSGIQRKDESKMSAGKFFYATTIAVTIKDVPSIGYKTLHVIDEAAQRGAKAVPTNQIIENEFYIISYENRQVKIIDKLHNKTYEKAIYLEESGDEGDNYDYSNPTLDMIITDSFENANVTTINAGAISKMVIKGSMLTPKTLEERAVNKLSTVNDYEIELILKQNDKVIGIIGEFDNKANNHRIRLAFRSFHIHKNSIAGTAFGYINRETEPANLQEWRSKTFDNEPIESDNDWLEEPTPTYPLLNHVSLAKNDDVVTVFTRSAKEYEVIGEGYTDIAVTLFRATGHLGLPDLNRRPGRASGLQEKLFETPLSQMQGINQFELGLSYYSEYDGNIIGKDYTNFATDKVYYQNQKLERVVFPICFLDVAPLGHKIEEVHSMIELVDSEGTFGTYVKSTTDEAYILRIFNNSNSAVNAGYLKGNCKEVRFTNLLCQNDAPATKELGILKPGEIKNIKIFY